MMFEVEYKGKVYEVYNVDIDENGTYFLIFTDKWERIDCNECVPHILYCG